LVGEHADVIIGCVGGGSNFAGLALPFVRDRIYGDDIQILAVEPTACPTLTRDPYAYDFGDTAATTPLLAMHTPGSIIWDILIGSASDTMLMAG